VGSPHSPSTPLLEKEERGLIPTPPGFPKGLDLGPLVGDVALDV